MLKQGKFRAEKVTYPDGVGCCIWLPLADDEQIGHCFDFLAEDLDDLITLLQRLRDAAPEPYEAEEKEALR